MKELKCPNCGKAFTVNEADYASIVNQVKNAEFNAEVDRRIEELHKQHEVEEELAASKAEQAFQDKLSEKDKALSEKDAAIVKLQAEDQG